MRKRVPLGVRNKLKDVNQQGVDVMNRLYEINSRINVVGTLNTRPGQPQISLKNEPVMGTCLKAPAEALEIFDPFLVQSVSRVLFAVVDDIPRFARAVCEAKNSQFYPHLISVTIPAVFGHFAVRDSLEMALEFYQEVFAHCDPTEFTRIVAPFFRCAAVVEYGRVLYEETSGKTFLLKQSNKQFEDNLLANAVKFLALLPDTHLRIVKLISENWKNEMCWKFLIHILVVPAIRLYGPLSACENCDKPPVDIPSVIKNMLEASHSGRFEVSSIFPAFEVPKCFVGYGVCCPLKFIITLRDIFALQELNLEYPGRTRDVVKNCSYADMYQPFIVKIFAKALKSDRADQPNFFEHPKPVVQITDSKFKNLWSVLLAESDDPVDLLTKTPIVTGNRLLNGFLRTSNLSEVIEYAVAKGIEEVSMDCDLFEEFLKLKLEVSLLHHWLDRCLAYFNIVGFAAARRDMRFCVKSLHAYGNSPIVVRRYLPHMHEIQHWGMIFGLCFVEVKILEPHLATIQSLEKKVEELCKSCREIYHKQHFENPVIQEGIWRASAVLPFVTQKSRFIRRFTVLRTFLESIENLVCFLDNGRFDINFLIHFSIAVHDAAWIVRTVMLLEGTLFNNTAFMRCCTQRERDMWTMIIVSLKGFLANVPNLKEEYESTTRSITR